MEKRRVNGEGSIHKRTAGRWAGRYTAGRAPVSGKAIYKNVLCPELRRGTAVDPQQFHEGLCTSEAGEEGAEDAAARESGPLLGRGNVQWRVRASLLHWLGHWPSVWGGR